LGVYGLVADLGNILPAIAFGIGLTFGYSFDTAGPRTVVEEDVRRHEHVRDADAPLTAEQQHAYAGPRDVDVRRDEVPARDVDADGYDDRPATTTTATTRERQED
ncbi:MAG: hypothetical protein ACRDNB_12620, partial [Gaiellaceae bacterium]